MDEKKASFREWYHQPKLCNTTRSFNLVDEMKSVAVVGMVGDLPTQQDLTQQVFLMDFTKNNPGFGILWAQVASYFVKSQRQCVNGVAIEVNIQKKKHIFFPFWVEW